jgi:hypothetical protein
VDEAEKPNTLLDLIGVVLTQALLFSACHSSPVWYGLCMNAEKWITLVVLPVVLALIPIAGDRAARREHRASTGLVCCSCGAGSSQLPHKVLESLGWTADGLMLFCPQCSQLRSTGDDAA